MDSFEWNKIAGAVLATVMFVLVIKFASDAIFEAPVPAKPGYVVEGVTEETSNASAPAAPVEEALPDFGTVLPAADAAAGQKVSARCEQCHDLSKGGAQQDRSQSVGRHRPGARDASGLRLFVGHERRSRAVDLRQDLPLPEIAAGLRARHQDELRGITSANDRINLIAWLRTQSDSPVAIPAPAPAKPAAAPARPLPTRLRTRRRPARRRRRRRPRHRRRRDISARPTLLLVVPVAWAGLWTPWFEASGLRVCSCMTATNMRPGDIDYTLSFRPPPGLLKTLPGLKTIFSLVPASMRSSPIRIFPKPCRWCASSIRSSPARWRNMS